MGQVLGISAYYHDSAAVLLEDGRIAAAAQEERFTRKKHDSSFPDKAVGYVLEAGGCRLEDLDAIAFYDKPFLKFERLLETYHAFAPRGLASFTAAMPVWIKEKLFLRSELRRALQKFKSSEKAELPPLLFPEHHLSHAAAAFFPSPFEEAAILTIDGVGEWATTSICKGSGSGITVLREIHFPHSLGLLYSAFTAYCGFKVNSGEYKLMGLAPYGRPGAESTERYRALIFDHLLDLRDDGSYVLNMDYFNYATGLTMFHEARWRDLFGLPPRRGEGDELTQPYMDMALAIQQATEQVVLRLAATALELAQSENLCLAGGVALNCVANGKIIEKGLPRGFWAQPASGDDGGALGAALSAHYIHAGAPRATGGTEQNTTLRTGEGFGEDLWKGAGRDAMQGAYLGPEFSPSDIRAACRAAKAVAHEFTNFPELASLVAAEIASGKVVGWFQGRMEFGPRALGNRSILGDPRNPEMQKKLNLKIKYREGFRPFAPSVLEERVSEMFELDIPSPYMLLVAKVKEKYRFRPPDDYNELGMWERLYFKRSSIPAVTHIDFSARIQSVSQATNPRYHALIRAFADLTGVPLLVNTSFNVRGEPIVCTPLDAYSCFLHTEMDLLVLGDLLLRKEEQPGADKAGPDKAGQWAERFEKD